ncbi:hypothetical protein [Glycomyces tritici]|uniref:Uncharacterized protein n=1 Tax=Glycomyces tritici TaxID=2665176 RepID=A0ABT7YNV8_9ACTN|nr:hypothetical protein [Glycomyces tritici]MDN3240079.1 hypothetical protein [Glycomyces tritici]
MAETAAAAGESRARVGRRSDGGSSTLGLLGDFARGHALFSLYRLGPDLPDGACGYLIDCDDGVGPHEVCRFIDEPAEPVDRNTEGFQVVWRGAWKNDQWCPWILKRARSLIAASGDD